MSDDVPPDSLIPYDDIVQDALRGTVYGVLKRIEEAGALPGEHHFYIAFKTRAPGVEMPRHLLERYPEEMTIVIQHRYWDLEVTREMFTIGLSFNQVPTKLVIPMSAVVGFVDPSVNFALQFPPPDGLEDRPALRAIEDETGQDTSTAPAVPAKTPEKKNAEANKAKPESENEDDGSNVVEIDFRKK